MTKSKAYTTSSCYGGPQLLRQNQKLHGKNKNLTAKPKTLRQKQRPHGKNKYFRTKTKYLTAKANTHGKTKTILLLLWSIWFCRDVFVFAVRYFVFAVRFLVLSWGILFLLWGFWFCRDILVFAERFLVLPWQLWATISCKFKGESIKNNILRLWFKSLVHF